MKTDLDDYSIAREMLEADTSMAFIVNDLLNQVPDRGGLVSVSLDSIREESVKIGSWLPIRFKLCCDRSSVESALVAKTILVGNCISFHGDWVRAAARS